MDKNEELQKWLDDDRYVRVEDIMALHGLSRGCVYSRLKRSKIKPEKKIFSGPKGRYFFYNKKQCDVLITAVDIKRADAQKMKTNSKYVRPQQLETLWGISKSAVAQYLKYHNIQPIKEMHLGPQLGSHVFYDRAECERARPFINQPEKEVEKVEQVNLPEPKEQTPDIIPADTIDLFTMSEFESELKQRGVELTDEVKAKINASDMPEMQEIATMIRGDAKTIAIRLSVLNEIAGQLKYDNTDIREDPKISMDVHTNDGRIEKCWLNTDLRPCILCGGDKLAVDVEESQNDNWHASILCCKCGDSSVCADDSNLHDVMDSLIDNWQMRHHAISAPNKKSKKGIGGAKSKYDENFPVLAKEYARQGATDKAISEYLGISQDTFYRYCKEYPLFAKALTDGRIASPFDLNGLKGKSASERYLLLMQQQLNDMQKMIEKLVKKLDGVNITEKKIFMKNGKVLRMVVTETELEGKNAKAKKTL